MTKENEKMMALATVQENIEDFLSDWYSVSVLYETAANVSSILLGGDVLSKFGEERKFFIELIDQHVMLTNLLKDCEKVIKDGRSDKEQEKE